MLGDWIDDLISFGKDQYTRNQGQEIDKQLLKQTFPQLSDDNLINQALGVIDTTVKDGRSKDSALSLFPELKGVQTLPTIQTVPQPVPQTIEGAVVPESKGKIEQVPQLGVKPQGAKVPENGGATYTPVMGTPEPNLPKPSDFKIWDEVFRLKKEINFRKNNSEDTNDIEEQLEKLRKDNQLDSEDFSAVMSLPAGDGVSYNFKQLFDAKASGNRTEFNNRLNNYKWQGALLSGLNQAFLDKKLDKGTRAEILKDWNRFLNVGVEGVSVDPVTTDIDGWAKAHARFRDYMMKYTDGSAIADLDRAMIRGYADRFDKKSYKSSGNINEYQTLGLEVLKVVSPERYQQAVSVIRDSDPENKNYDYQIGYQSIMRDLESYGLNSEYQSVLTKLEKLQSKSRNGGLTNTEMSDYDKLYQRKTEIDMDMSRLKFRYPNLTLMETREAAHDFTGEDRNSFIKQVAYQYQSALGNAISGIGNIVSNMSKGDKDLTNYNIEEIGKRRTDQFIYGQTANQDIFNTTFIDVKPELQAKLDLITRGDMSPEEKLKKTEELFFNNPDGWERKSKDATFNIGTESVLNSVVTYGAQLAGVVVAGGQSRGLQSASMFMMQLNDSYTSNLEDGRSKPMERAILTSVMSALGEGSVDNWKSINRMMGDKAREVFSDETFKLLSKADKNKFGRIYEKIKSVAKDQTVSNLEQGFEEGFQRVLMNMADGKDLTEGVVQEFTGALIAQAGFTSVGSIINYNKTGAATKEMLYRAGLQPDVANGIIDQQLADGKINQAEADRRKQVVKDMASIVEKTEALRVDGSSKETAAAIDHAFRMFVRSRAGKIEVPASMKEQYDKIIAELDESIGAYDPSQGEPATLESISGKELTSENLGEIRDVLNTDLQEHERQVLADVALSAKRTEGTGIKFRVFSDNQQFAQTYEDIVGQKADPKAPAAFDPESGTVFINLSGLKGDSNWNAVWHESVHPILNIIRNTDPEKYNALLDGLKDVAGFESKQAQKFGEKGYQESSKETQKDEAITEFFANIRKGYVDLNNIPTTFKQKMIDAFNAMMDVAGIDYKIEDTKGRKFINAAREISAVLTGEKSLSEFVGENNLGKFQRDDIQNKNKTDYVESAGMRKQMTEDDDGNYVFYHYSDKDLRRAMIDPRKFGNNRMMTGRDENPMKGISMYYTRPDIKEQGISDRFGHIVRIPKSKVYPFNADPLNLLPKARAEFAKENGNIAFDFNKQVAWVADEAAKRGYPMTVAKWGKYLRAQTTIKMKPELYQEGKGFNVVETKPHLDFKPNAKRKDIPAKAQFRRSLTKADIAGEEIKKIGKRDGWAIITATREDLGSWDSPENKKANRKLLTELRSKFGEENIVRLSGSYLQVDQGPSFMVLNASEDVMKEMGQRYGQESILTKRGNVFSDGTGYNPASGKVIVGDKARRQDGYSITEDGTAFSLDIDWGKRETGIDEENRKAAIDANPNYFENVKKFANESSYPNKLEFKRALQDRMKNFIKDLKKVYGDDFNPADMSWKTMQYVKDVLTAEAKNAIAAHPESIGWYDEKTKNALAIMSILHPELETDIDKRAAFIVALAITSNGNKVDKNFEYAEQQYAHFKEFGVFDPEVEFGIQQTGIQKSLEMVNSVITREGITALTKFFMDKHRAGDLSYKDINGKKKDLAATENADTMVYGATILGSKIGNGFYMNLWGEFGQLTMDRWFMRTWGRITGTLINVIPERVDKARDRYNSAIEAVMADPEASAALKQVVKNLPKNINAATEAIKKASSKKDARAVLQGNSKTDELRMASNAYQAITTGEVEAPISGSQRNFIREVFAGIQENLKNDGIDITMADLQAVLWYPEKILYESFKEGDSFEAASEGYSSGEAPDYQNAASKLAKSKGITDEQINEALGRRGRSAVDPDGGRTDNSRDDINANRERVINAIRQSRGQLRRSDFDAAIAIATEDGSSILELPSTSNYIRVEKAGSGFMVNVFDREDNQISDASPILTKNEAYKAMKNLSWKHGMPSTQFRKTVNGFYSPIEKRVEEFKQSNASAQKWKEIVGIKSDEAVFSGLSGWLNSRQPNEQIKKEEILDFIDKNRIEINEVVKAGSARDVRYAVYNNGHYDTSFGTREVAEKYIEIMGGAFSIEEERGRPIHGDTRYESYTLAGDKKDYKEILITMPPKGVDDSAYMELKRASGFDTLVYVKENYGIRSGEYDSMKRQVVNDLADRMGYDYSDIRDMFSAFESQDKSGVNYKHNHWDESNVLAHIRLDRRVDSDGNNVLFLEEVQSDWGQEGKSKGFKDSERLEQLKNERNVLLDKTWNDGLPSITPEEQSRFEELEKEINGLLKAEASGVDKAPFVTNTNSWTKLGLKYALKQAVDQGADVLAWTTGDQQNDRYKLSNSVDEVFYFKNHNGTFNISANKKDSLVFSERNISEDRLVDIVGKELATKIIEDGKRRAQNSYKGVDLNVGGKGMKAFYGDAENAGIVGNVAKALVKELTGENAELTAVEIDTIVSEDVQVKDIKASEVDAYRRDGWEVFQDNDGSWSAIKEDGTPAKSKQPAIRITDKLRESVRNGMPQFRKGSDASYGTHISISDLRINENDNVRTMVNKLRAYNGSLNPIIDYISKLPELDSARVMFTDETTDFGYMSEARAKAIDMPEWSKVIVIPTQTGIPNAYYALTHELLHFVTLDSNNVKRYGSQKKLEEIRKIYNKYKSMGKEFDGSIRTYGITNEHEFFVESILNPTFRAFLNERVEPTFIEKLKEFIKDMLNNMGIKIGSDKPMIQQVVELAEDVFFNNEFEVKSIDQGDTIYGDVKADGKMTPAFAGSQLRVSLYTRNRMKEAWDKTTKARGIMPKEIFDAKMDMERAIQGHIENIDMLSNALRKEAKKIWKTGFFKSDLDPVAAQVINDALADYTKIANLPPSIQPIVRDMRNSLDAMSDILIKMGIVNGPMAAVVDKNIGTYLNRSYRKYFDEDWAKHVDQSIVDEAFDYIKKFETRDDGMGGRRRLTDEEVAGELNKIVSGKPKSNIIAGSKAGSKDISNLKTRMIYDQEVDTIIATPVAGGYKLEGWLGLDRMVDRVVAPDNLDKAVGKEVADRIRNAGLLFGGQYQGTANNKWLVISDEIPEPIRKLMGEYKDPIVNYANTALKLAQLIEKQKFLNKVRTELDGVFFFSEPTGEFATPVTAADSNTMNPLDEVRYTTPEIAEAFQKTIDSTGSGINSAFIRAWMYLNGLAKMAKTVGSPTAQIRNAIGGFMMNMANARSPFSENMVKGFASAWNLISGGKDDERAFRAHVRELTSLGILDESLDYGVVKDIMKRLHEGEEPLKKFTNPSFIGRMIKDNKITELYKTTDNWMRIWAFHQEYATLKKFKPNMSDAEAKRQAAEIVRSTYPTYSQAPEWVKSLSRNVAVSSFPLFTTEVIRTSLGTFRQAFNEMKDSDLRAVGVQRFVSMVSVMVLPSMLMAASKAINGYDDKDEEDVVAMSPDYLKDNTKFYLPRTKDGKPSFIDISASDSYGYIKKPMAGAFREGSKNGVGAGVGEFFKETLNPFTDPELFTGKMLEAIESFEPTDSRTDKAIKVGMKAKEALEPAGVTSGRKIIYGAMEKPLDGKMYDPKREAVAMASGQRYYDIDPVRSQYFAAAEFNRYKNAKSAEYGDAIRKMKSKEEIDDEYQQSLDEIMERYEKLREITQAAMRQMAHDPAYKGSSSAIRKELINQMKGLRVNRDVVLAALDNKPFPKRVFKRKPNDPNED